MTAPVSRVLAPAENDCEAALDGLLVGQPVNTLSSLAFVVAGAWLVSRAHGGVGLVEAGMAGTYTALGVVGSTAVAGVIGYRVISFWLPVTIGLVAYYRHLVADVASTA